MFGAEITLASRSEGFTRRGISSFVKNHPELNAIGHEHHVNDERFAGAVGLR